MVNLGGVDFSIAFLWSKRAIKERIATGAPLFFDTEMGLDIL